MIYKGQRGDIGELIRISPVAYQAKYVANLPVSDCVSGDPLNHACNFLPQRITNMSFLLERVATVRTIFRHCKPSERTRSLCRLYPASPQATLDPYKPASDTLAHSASSSTVQYSFKPSRQTILSIAKRKHSNRHSVLLCSCHCGL